MLLYAALADLVLVAHLAFVAFAALGGLVALWWRRVIWLHLPVVAWGAFIEISGGICPLTPLENTLRTAAGEAAYREDFLQHYLVAVLYPSALTRGIQFTLAALLVTLNVLIYAALWRRGRLGRPRRRRGPSP